MAKKKLKTSSVSSELKGTGFFPKDNAENNNRTTPLPHPKVVKKDESIPKTKKVVKKYAGREVRKFTSKLVSSSTDPAINKVGYYFTRKEIDQLDNLVTKLKPILRDKYNQQVTRSDIIRACLIIGLVDWEEDKLAGKLLNLLRSK